MAQKLMRMRELEIRLLDTHCSNAHLHRLKILGNIICRHGHNCHMLRYGQDSEMNY